MNVRYSKEMLATVVKECECVSDVMRKMGVRCAGGSHSHISRKLKEYNIDISHFVGTTKARGRNHNFQKKKWTDILTLRYSGERRSAFQLRRALIEYGRPYFCGECGLSPIWNGKELRFQVDHKNKNWLDDRPENLRFMCPNCHTQTEGYSGSKGFTKVICRIDNRNGILDQLEGVARLRNENVQVRVL